MSKTTVYVEYQRSPRWPKRRYWKWGGCALAIFLFGLGVWRFGPSLWGSAKMLDLQSKCENYQIDPATLAYWEGTQLPSEILDNKSYLRLSAMSDGTERIVHQVPSCWWAYRACFPSRGPPIMTRTDAGGSIDTKPSPLLFLHRRSTASGQERIVMVGLALPPEAQPRATRFCIVGEIVTPGTWQQKPFVESSFIYTQGAGMADDPTSTDTMLDDGKLRFYSGVPDPNNRDRFTVSWEFNGLRKTLTGILRDGDQFGMHRTSVVFEGLP